VALHLREHFKGHVQAAVGTVKASSNLNGPTIHSAFCWSIDKAYTSSTEKDEKDDQVTRAVSVRNEMVLKELYGDTEEFIFD
jgi:hypothetical protein